MSILDLDEHLIEIAQRATVVYGPYVDVKEFPENVDLTLVEGAVSSEDDLHKIRKIRARTRLLVSLGDCGITGNVPSMRNAFGVKKVLERAYGENGAAPMDAVPRLLPAARPVHEFVKVDLFIPGCPPSAETIKYALGELLEGRMPDLSGETRFGA
jgi:NAD-reducing hydrogenase small subunit